MDPALFHTLSKVLQSDKLYAIVSPDNKGLKWDANSQKLSTAPIDWPGNGFVWYKPHNTDILINVYRNEHFYLGYEFTQSSWHHDEIKNAGDDLLLLPG